MLTCGVAPRSTARSPWRSAPTPASSCRARALRGFPERHRGRGEPRRRRARRRGWASDPAAPRMERRRRRGARRRRGVSGGDGTALPPATGGAGYAFQEFINVGFSQTRRRRRRGRAPAAALGPRRRGTLPSGAAPAISADGAGVPAPRAFGRRVGGIRRRSPARWSLPPGTPRQASWARAAARAPPRAAAAAAAAGARGVPSPPSGRPRRGRGRGRSGGAARPGSTAPPAHAQRHRARWLNATLSPGRRGRRRAYLADGAWGSCAVTGSRARSCRASRPACRGRRRGVPRALLRGRAGASEGGFQWLSARAPGRGRRRRRALGGGVVHLEVSESVALTGDAHLLHGGPRAPVSLSFLPTKKSSLRGLVHADRPLGFVADKSTIRVAGGLGWPARRLGFSRCAAAGPSAPPPPRDAASYVFNVATVRVDSGGCWSWMARARSPSPAVRGPGSLTVGDEDERICRIEPRRRRPPRSSRELVSTSGAPSAAGRRARDELRHR